MVNDPHPQGKDPHPGPEATFTMWEMDIFFKKWDPHPLRSLSRFFKKVHFDPHCPHHDCKSFSKKKVVDVKKNVWVVGGLVDFGGAVGNLGI